MTINEQLRRRLAAGITAALLVGSLVAGAVSVSADDETTAGQEKHETNQGAEAVGLVQETTLTVNSIVAPVVTTDGAVTAPAQGIAVVGNDGRDDNQ